MRVITMREAIREAMREEMLRDERVFIMGEDVGVYGGIFGVTMGMLEEFGEERVRDTPISEAAIAGTAIGAAMTGMRPIAEIMFIDFTTIASDQIINQGAKWHYMSGGRLKVPVVIRTFSGTGRRTAAQHSQSLEAWYAHIPGLKVVMPGTAYDAKGLLKTSIRDDNPVIFVEHKLLLNDKGEVPEEEYLISLGKADIKREGSDCTVIAIGWMVPRALKAAEMLANEGISVEVLDPRTLRPLDIDTICTSIQKTNRAVIVHEACKTGGIGAEIAAQIMEHAFYDLDVPVGRVCGLDVPIPFSPVLEDAVVPSAEQIAAAVREIV